VSAAESRFAVVVLAAVPRTGALLNAAAMRRGKVVFCMVILLTDSSMA
jgi:hypothetical protein